MLRVIESLVASKALKSVGSSRFNPPFLKKMVYERILIHL